MADSAAAEASEAAGDGGNLINSLTFNWDPSETQARHRCPPSKLALKFDPKLPRHTREILPENRSIAGLTPSSNCRIDPVFYANKISWRAIVTQSKEEIFLTETSQPD